MVYPSAWKHYRPEAEQEAGGLVDPAARREYNMAGVLEENYIGYSLRKAQERVSCAGFLIFKTLFSIPDHYSYPVKSFSISQAPQPHYSNNPRIVEKATSSGHGFF
jgi:hypothetical protein